MKIEKDVNRWLFADQIPQGKTVPVKINNFEVVKSKDGKTDIPVFHVAVEKATGDLEVSEYMLSLWNIADRNTLIDKWGDDTNEWIDKEFLLESKKGKFYITPIDEK